jgi:hypothetical protein
MPDLILYQRDYCHLCDLALAVLAEARAPDFDSEWVDDSPELEARYGLRVPVLRDNRAGRELDWPFDAAAIGVAPLLWERLLRVCACPGDPKQEIGGSSRSH